MMSPAPRPVDQIVARGWIKEIVGSTLDEIIPGAWNKIQFLSPNQSVHGELRVCEVKIKDREWAPKIRKECGRLRKEGR